MCIKNAYKEVCPWLHSYAAGTLGAVPVSSSQFSPLAGQILKLMHLPAFLDVNRQCYGIFPISENRAIRFYIQRLVAQTASGYDPIPFDIRTASQEQMEAYNFLCSLPE
jgi:hypothetical protein